MGDLRERPTNEIEDPLEDLTAGHGVLAAATVVDFEDRGLRVLRHACFSVLSRVQHHAPIGGCLAERTRQSRPRTGWTRFHRLALLFLILSPVVTAQARASMSPTITHCRYEKALTFGNPGSVDHLRIRMRARRVDGYLPRCSLATFVAFDATGQHRIVEKGARWYVGAFFCSYSSARVAGRDEIRIQTRCVHTGRYTSTVWFDAYA